MTALYHNEMTVHYNDICQNVQNMMKIFFISHTLEPLKLDKVQ